MKNNSLPEPFKNVMVTYNKTITFGPYHDQVKKQVVTKMGFYSDLFNNFAVPPEWRKFNGVLLPHGFGGDHIPIDKIIKWKYCD